MFFKENQLTQNSALTTTFPIHFHHQYNSTESNQDSNGNLFHLTRLLTEMYAPILIIVVQLVIFDLPVITDTMSFILYKSP